MADFLVDADCPHILVHLLRAHGQGGTHVREVGLGTAADEVILEYARDRGLIIVSRDLDWTDIRSYHAAEKPGFVVLRVPANFRAEQIAEVFRSFLESVEPETLHGALTIIEPGRYRLRPL